MSLINVKVAKISQEAEGVRSFLLAKKGWFKLPSYEPGSHIDVHCGDGIIRQYSLCGDPTDQRHYMIAVRHVQPSRGGSDLMHETVREGDLMEIGSPRNHFTLDENAPHSHLLAGGIGITPLIAMADRLHALGRSFELHYFSRSPSSTAFRQRLQNGSFGAKVTLHEGLDIAQTGARFRAILNSPTNNEKVYICGPGPFMDTAEAIALETRDSDAVRLERFAANPALAGGPTAPFDIELARSGIKLTVQADETILQVLEANNIDAAFSCEHGVCGTCVTDIIDGIPDHRDSFLSAKLQAAGKKMCVCVSRADGDKIVLDI